MRRNELQDCRRARLLRKLRTRLDGIRPWMDEREFRPESRDPFGMPGLQIQGNHLRRVALEDFPTVGFNIQIALDLFLAI